MDQVGDFHQENPVFYSDARPSFPELIVDHIEIRAQFVDVIQKQISRELLIIRIPLQKASEKHPGRKRIGYPAPDDLCFEVDYLVFILS